MIKELAEGYELGHSSDGQEAIGQFNNGLNPLEGRYIVVRKKNETSSLTRNQREEPQTAGRVLPWTKDKGP